jgi:hypothetical protein
MATRRRSRRKSISGNLTDVQKRIRYLETRPSATRLASKAVATRNLALRAINEDIVADNAIVRRSIAAAAVGTAEIENSAITSQLLAANSVTSTQIENGSVGTGELANDSVTNDKLATDSVNSDSILAGSVGNTELGGGITDDKIAGMSSSKLIGQIQNDQIAGIEGSKIIGGIDGDLIVAKSVTGGKLADDTITALQLATNSVTDDAIASLSVGYSQLKKYSVLSDNIPGNAIIGRAGTHPFGGSPHLQNFTIGSDDIFSGSITTTKIATSAVTSGKIADGAVTDAKVATGISSTKITGLSNLLGTASVSGTGISRSFSASGNFRSLNIAISAGTGSNQLAIGNHTHAASGITSLSGGNAIRITGSGSSRTIAVTPGTYASSGHGHGRKDTSFAGSHVGHGGHTHFVNVTSSSKKLKKEISDYSINIEKLFLLQPKKFKYKNQARLASKNREWDYGYIAEEALALGVEEIVGYNEKGEVDSINYGLLSVFVLEIVKKQQNDIESLKQEIERLKERNDS